MLTSGKDYWTSREAIKSLVHAIVRGDMPELISIKRAINENPAKCLKAGVGIAKRLGTYWPELADYYTKLPISKEFIAQKNEPSFVTELIIAVATVHPNLLVEELEHALHSGLPEYKYHTGPKIPDLIAMVKEYYKLRVQWFEDAHHSQKVQLDQYDLSVIEAFKRAQEEGAQELKIEREEKDKAEKKRRSDRRAELDKQAEKLLSKKQK